MGSSGALGSVITMPLELAATARSSRRRISSEASRPGSLSYAAPEERVFNTRILQPYGPTSYAPLPPIPTLKVRLFGVCTARRTHAIHERRAQNGLRAA